jgi:hypothetical protein
MLASQEAFCSVNLDCGLKWGKKILRKKDYFCNKVKDYFLYEN